MNRTFSDTHQHKANVNRDASKLHSFIIVRIMALIVVLLLLFRKADTLFY